MTTITQDIATLFGKRITAALAILTKGGPITPADLATVSTTLADTLAADVDKMLEAKGTAAAATHATALRAARSSALAASSVVSTSRQSAEDAAFDRFSHEAFGFPRDNHYDAAGNAIPLVRLS